MKKVFFGVAVVAIALSASAFTNANVATGDVYVNTSSGSNPTFAKLTSAYLPVSDANCLNEVSIACYYTVSSAGASIVTANSYTESQLEAFQSNGYVVQSIDGLYIIP